MAFWGGFSGTITLACAPTSSPDDAPDLPTCTGSKVTLGGGTTTGTTAITVTTTAVSSIRLAWPSVGSKSRAWPDAGAVLAFQVFLGIPARRRSWRSMLGLLLLMAALGGLAACGGHRIRMDRAILGTIAGIYTFTVTGTGSPSILVAPYLPSQDEADALPTCRRNALIQSDSRSLADLAAQLPS